MIAAALKLLSSPHAWWAALAAALALTNCATGHQRDTARQQLAQARSAHAQAEATRAETARLAEAGHRARERAHAATLQATNQKAHDEKNRLALDLRRALNSLRHRPERPATAGGDVPESAADGMACTGDQLYRPDGEFLAREATRADQLRIDLSACQAAYDAAVILTAPP